MYRSRHSSCKCAQVVELALGVDKVKAFTDGKKIVKVIYVAGRILNLVVK
jgi:leucyl-tRNA synthetase